MRKAAYQRKSLSHSVIRSRSPGLAAEKEFAKQFGARQISGSGSGREKSDGEFGNFRFENKSTMRESMSLQRKWLEKISKEARGNEQIPLLTFQFVDEANNVRPFGAWICIPEFEFKELIDG